MSGYEPEREVLMSREDDSSEVDEDDLDAVLFERSNVVRVNGKGSYKTDTRCSLWWWIVGILLLSLSVFLCVLYYTNYGLPLLVGHWKAPRVVFNKTSDWTVTIPEHGTESCVRLVDVDEDGRDDIIFGMYSTKYFTKIATMTSTVKMKKLCLDNGDAYPCAGQIVALRGYDGKELWRTNIYMAPFELNCNNIDIDGDGKPDCIACGRMGTAVAFNPRNGAVLWNIDPDVVHPTWNFYNSLVMPDLTQDSVPEVLFSHGGDPRFEASQHKRISGRLILVSGRTGHSLGRYLNMTQYVETYMSPALHTTKDGSQYVLYGQGGETVKGDLLGISVPDLYRYVKNLSSDAIVPNTRSAYTGWKDKVHFLGNGVFAIYRSETRGVMVTPTLVDMNGDGVNDIVMSAYDGTMRLYDGETLEVKWSAHFPGFESYSTLAPGYFNDDDTLDFMFHTNRGSWPKYLYSQAIVIDGLNGEVLWRMNSTKYEMTSDLVARTTENYRDAFVFQMEGLQGPASDARKARRSRTHDVKKRSGPVIYKEGDPNYSKILNLFNKTVVKDLQSADDLSGANTVYDEEGDSSYGVDGASYHEDTNGSASHDNDEEHHPVCTEEMRQYVTHVFLLDRYNVHSPNVLMELPSIKFYFNKTSEDGTRRRSINTESSAEFCMVLKNDERTTGVLGDVDGDGNMDVISIIDSEGEGRDKNNIFLRIAYTVRIVKTNLADALGKRHHYPAKLDIYMPEKMRDAHGAKPTEELAFRPMAEQPWTQYLGQRSDHIYKKHG